MKICNFGSLNIDHVYSVKEFVRPGETLSCKSYHRFSGGKGLNQSIACARAGAQVGHAGAIGEDGLFLKEILEVNGVNIQDVLVVKEATGHAIIQVNEEGENCILLSQGANHTCSDSMVDEVLTHYSKGDLLILQNETNVLATIIPKANAKGMKIVLNPSPMTDSLKILPFEYIDYLILNEIEGEALSGCTTPEQILDTLCNRYEHLSIVLTLGALGVKFGKASERIMIPAEKVKAVDTTAAGDTFTGFFCAAMISGKSIESALITAVKASAICVTRQGAAQSIPSLSEIVI